MKKTGSFLVVTELLIVMLVSLAAGYALFGVSINSAITFGVLLLLGILTIIILPLSSLFFGTSALLAILPASMKLNSVKWWAFSEESLDFCPNLGFPVVLAIGLAVVSGSLLLNYIHSLRRELRTIEKTGVIPPRKYASSQSLATGVAILVCTVLALVISLVIFAMQDGLTNWFNQLPLWTLSVGGFTALVILALVIFWLAGVRRNSR
jgi:hypothetical protein